MNIKINDKNVNQDNSSVIINPYLKTTAGKTFMIISSIIVFYVIINFIDSFGLKQFYIEYKKVILIELILIVLSIIYVLFNYIFSKINVHKIEKNMRLKILNTIEIY